MRYTFLILILSVLLVCVIGCAATGEKVTVKSGQSSETRVYEVFGMDCPGCHGGLEKLVEKIPAIQHSEANWQEKRLAVVVRPGTELNDEDIYDAVRRANFTPGERVK